MPRIGKSVDTESRLVVATGRQEWGVTAKRCSVPFWGDKNMLKEWVVTVTQPCEHTKNKTLCTSKWLFYICELYLNLRKSGESFQVPQWNNNVPRNLPNQDSDIGIMCRPLDTRARVCKFYAIVSCADCVTTTALQYRTVPSPRRHPAMQPLVVTRLRPVPDTGDHWSVLHTFCHFKNAIQMESSWIQPLETAWLHSA